MELIITITYRIWHARNLLVFQENKVPVNQVIQQAQINAKELRTNPFTMPRSLQLLDLAATTITGNLHQKAL
jgi:hypothetical protein